MERNVREIRRARLRDLLGAQPEPKHVNLSKLLKRSAAQVSQWLSGYRTITEDSAREIERNARKPQHWLDMPVAPLVAGEPTPPWSVAQDLSPLPNTDSPVITWGENMHPLPQTFRLAAPDESMAPRVRKGVLLEFDTTLTPQAGDGVLVRDDAGHWYFRMYRERRPGHWEAAAANPDVLPLDSVRDGLQVLAVMTAVFQRWG